MPRGDLITFMGMVALALLFAELQVRQEATSRWVCLAILWVVTSGLLIWLAYG